ncbi:TPA: polysaccharide biosynthesis protein [Vibrio vulnificus]|nr:polysaccharide biosynthesis protein [Vibrio vulnificus]
MTLRTNLISNYASQIYTTLIAIVVLPFYMNALGPEAYGLIAFYMMLQAWFNLLDLGLTPTISRETARYFCGALALRDYKNLTRALLAFFLMVSFLGGFFLYLSSDFLVHRWLKIELLGNELASNTVKLMAIIVSLRWLGGLFRGVIVGAEKLVYLSACVIFFTSFRFLGVFLSMYAWGYTIDVFFIHQLLSAILELLTLIGVCYKVIPDRYYQEKVNSFSIKPIKSTVRFSLSVAFTAAIWVVVTQTDKLILSGILSLDAYGYYSLAVIIASSVMIISGPISNVIMPRLTKLYVENDEVGFTSVYRSFTQFICVVAGSISAMLVYYSEPIIYTWTSDGALSKVISPIVMPYAIGNLFLSVSAFVYYYQYAKGQLRLHVVGNALFAMLLIPMSVIGAKLYGGLGAGYAWLFANSLYLVIWVSYVHTRLGFSLAIRWFLVDVTFIICPIFFFVSLLPSLKVSNYTSIELAVTLAFIYLCVLAFSSTMSSGFRKVLIRKVSSVAPFKVVRCGKK